MNLSIGDRTIVEFPNPTVLPAQTLFNTEPPIAPETLQTFELSSERGSMLKIQHLIFPIISILGGATLSLAGAILAENKINSLNGTLMGGGGFIFLCGSLFIAKYFLEDPLTQSPPQSLIHPV